MIRRSELCATLVLIAALSGTACHGNPKPTPPPPAPAPPPAPPPATTPPPPPPPPAPKPAPAAPPTEEEVFRTKTLEQLNSEKPLGDVFFALDESDLTEQSRGTLGKDLEWLKKWTSTKIMVEGHADSRGTNEYNLALGERRASAVKDYLVSLGVTSGRIVVVSKGKEQPVCTDMNEACWQQNRRGHPVITGK